MGKKAEEKARYAYCQKLHAMKRARERLGVTMELSDYSIARGRILHGDAERLTRLSKSRVLYRLEVQGKPALAVWDRKTQEIVTFLTLEMGERYCADITI